MKTTRSYLLFLLLSLALLSSSQQLSKKNKEADNRQVLYHVDSTVIDIQQTQMMQKTFLLKLDSLLTDTVKKKAK